MKELGLAYGGQAHLHNALCLAAVARDSRATTVSRNKRLFSFVDDVLTGTPVGVPPFRGSCSPKVTERAIEDEKERRIENAEFYFYFPQFPDANYWQFCRELKNDGMKCAGHRRPALR